MRGGEIWLLVGSAALICSLLSAKGKRLGDIFAGTVAIQERLPGSGGQVAMMPPALAWWSASLELSGLPDQTAAMARQYLARFYEFSPAARDELGRRIAAAVAARIGPPPPPGTPPADYLSAVLAERRAREQARMPGPAAAWPVPAAARPAAPATWTAAPAAWTVPPAPAAAPAADGEPARPGFAPPA